MNRRPLLALLLALPLLLAGCKINTINSFPTNPAHVRMLNALPNVSAVNVAVDGTPTWSALAFQAMTSYTEFNNTQQHVYDVTVPGSTSILVSATFNLAGTASYTLIVYGTAEAPALALMPDDTSAPGTGNFVLRVADVATGAGPIDLYVTGPTGTIDSLNPNLSGIVLGSSTGFLQFSGGSYRIRFTQNATKNVIYDSGAAGLSFTAGSVIDLVGYTRSGGQLVNLLVAYVNGTQQAAIADSGMTELKIFNAAYQTGAINTYLNGLLTPLNSNIAYPAASGYNIIPPGSTTVAFEAVATPGATIATSMSTLQAATDSTLVLTGLAGALQTVVLNDLNYPPLDNNTRLRVVNASPDAPPLTFLLGTTQEFAGLAYLTASDYVEFGGGAYTLLIKDANGNTLLTLSNITLSASQTNTLYVSGPAAALVGTITQDN